MFDQIQPDNVQKIMEGIIKRLQRELQEARRESEDRQRRVNRMTLQLEQMKLERSPKTRY